MVCRGGAVGAVHGGVGGSPDQEAKTVPFFLHLRVPGDRRRVFACRHSDTTVLHCEAVACSGSGVAPPFLPPAVL
ncbi:hypothetical protein SESBI_09596 [Sesbania bispinosa]|nr:hypothetical protein SESBI_09596 [Sesbania bispinosa]